MPVLRRPSDRTFRAIALALGLFALAHAALLNEWIRGDSDRYLWVIRQLQPCASMGGGPGSLWVLATSVVFAAAAMIYAVAGGIDRRPTVAGIVIAATLTFGTAVAMFADPTMYARALGCL